MDEIRKMLAPILEQSPEQLDEAMIGVLRARVSYLTDAEIAKFASVLGQPAPAAAKEPKKVAKKS